MRFQAPELPRLERVQKYWNAAEETRWFSNGGPCIALLSERLAAYVGGGVHAVPVSSATSGLLAALSVLVENMDREYVMLPSYTFAATGAIVRRAGFRPLYVDIDPANWHAHPDAVDQVLATSAPRIAAAVLCSTYGAAPSRGVVQHWERSCRTHEIPLVVDSAAGFGSRDASGSPLGRAGDAEVFSFHATKPFAIGEGGVVVTRSADVAERVKRWCNFGFNEMRVVDGEPGLNGKMDELHAAMALCVLDELEEIVAARRSFAEYLRVALASEGFQFQEGAESSAHQFLPMLCADRTARDSLIARAKGLHIELRAYFGDPLHTMPAFHSDLAADLTATTDLASRVVCLPIYNHMTSQLLDRVVDVCRKAP